MSQKKKSGLQHTLSDILKEQQSLTNEEKSQYTAKLLSQVAPNETRPDLQPDLQLDPTEKPQEFSTTSVQNTGPTSVQSTGLDESTPVQSTGPIIIESAGPQSRGFLAFPHALLDRIFTEISNFSAFKIYLYLYREAFRRVHDERLSATCNISLNALTRKCAVSDKGVRKVLKILARDGWISIENRPGVASFYTIYRPITPVLCTGPTPVQSTEHLKNDYLKKDDDKERRSSSKKEAAAVEKHSRPDDDSLSIIKEVYEKLTANTWTAKDTEAYATIPKALQAEDIIRYIRAIYERTTKPIGSFAYFAKAILKEQSSPNTQKVTLKKLRKIVESVRNANVGRSGYSTADFREDVKAAAARAGVPYPPDMLEAAMKK